MLPGEGRPGGDLSTARAGRRLPSPLPSLARLLGLDGRSVSSWADTISVTMAQRGQSRARAGTGCRGWGQGTPAPEAPGDSCPLGGCLERISCVPSWQDGFKGNIKEGRTLSATLGFSLGSLVFWPVCPWARLLTSLNLPPWDQGGQS